MASTEKPSVDFSSRESSFDPPSYSISQAKDYTLQWEPPVGSKDLAIALSYHFPMEPSMENKMRAATKKFLKDEKRKAAQQAATHTVLETVVESSETVDTVHGPPKDDVGSQSDVECSNSHNPHTYNALFSNEASSTLKSRLASPRSIVREAVDEFKDSPNAESAVINSTEKKVSTNIQSSNVKATVSNDSQQGDLLAKVPTTEVQISGVNISTIVTPPLKSVATSQRLSWVNGLDQDEPKRRKRRYGVVEAAKVAANRGNACKEHKKRKVKCNPDSCPNNGTREKKGDKPEGKGLLNRILQKSTPDIRQRSIAGMDSKKSTTIHLATNTAPVSQSASSKQIDLSESKTNPAPFNAAKHTINNQTIMMSVPEPAFFPTGFTNGFESFDYSNDVLGVDSNFETFASTQTLNQADFGSSLHEDRSEKPFCNWNYDSYAAESPAYLQWMLCPMDGSSEAIASRKPYDAGSWSATCLSNSLNELDESNGTLSSTMHLRTQHFHHDVYSQDKSLNSGEYQARRKGFTLRDCPRSSKKVQSEPASGLRGIAAKTSRTFRQLLQRSGKNSGGEDIAEPANITSDITPSSISPQQCQWTYYGGSPSGDSPKAAGELAPTTLYHPSHSNIRLATNSQVFESPEMMSELNALAEFSYSEVIKF